MSGPRGFNLKGLINRVLREAGGSDPRYAWNMRTITTWDRIAGPAIAARTADVHLRNRELVVYVSSPAWAADLQAMSETYRTAFNTEFGAEVVDSIRFQPSRRAFRKRLESAQGDGPDSTVSRHVDPIPLTDEERVVIERTVSHIEDEKLKDALFKAMTADLQWKKGVEASKAAQNRSERP